MLNFIIKRLKNGRMATVGAFLFAALMSLALCGLHAASENEIKKYEEAYRTIPVTMTVQSLTGIRSDNLELPAWVIKVFTDAPMNTLTKDLQIKLRTNVDGASLDGTAVDVENLIGLSVPELDKELAKDEEAITWFDGFDAAALSSEGEELYVVVPQKYLSENGNASQLTVSLSYDNEFDYYPRVSIERVFRVIGTHSLDSDDFYCPYSTMFRIHKDLGKPIYADSVRATVANNDWLDKVRERVDEWFVEPSLTAERVPWNYSYYFYYPYALDVDDSALIHAGEVMKTNIMINKVSTVLVFVLSASAGFLVGFLMINRRKKEIMLMRTMGTPDRMIFRDFALEQMICAFAGVLFGGAFFLWRPVWRVGLFLAVYFVGLSISLIVFLRKNLLTTIKED
ncbi:MAG: ABC transporter permease [Clostridia bacterium]|nr:ABC transporter permease [Clostridia bacterium]